MKNFVAYAFAIAIVLVLGLFAYEAILDPPWNRPPVADNFDYNGR